MSVFICRFRNTNSVIDAPFLFSSESCLHSSVSASLSRLPFSFLPSLPFFGDVINVPRTLLFYFFSDSHFGCVGFKGMDK